MTLPAATARAAPTSVRPIRRVVVAALALGFALRLAFAFGYWVGKPLTLDEQEYLQLGTSLARGRGLQYAEAPGTRHFERPPAFAAFVGGVLWLTGAAPRAADETAPARSSSDVPASIKIAQALVGVVGAGLIAAVAAQAAGPVAAVAAACLAAVYPPLVWFCGYVLSEPLYSALALAVAWLLNAASRTHGVTDRTSVAGRARGRTRSLALVGAAGVLSGTAILTKEAMVFFVPLAAVWFVMRRRAVAALVFCAGVGLVLTPWIAHNYTVYGRFVLTAPHGGVTFWTGNNPLTPGEGDLAANPDMGRARVAFEQQHAGASSQDLDDAYYREAFRFIRQQPARWLMLLARKFFYTFAPIGPSYRAHSAVYFGASLASYVIVFAFGIAGLRRLVRARALSKSWALWLLAASTVVMSLVFFPQERFRIPVLDPALVTAAGVWFGSLGTLRRLFPGEPLSEGRD